MIQIIFQINPSSSYAIPNGNIEPNDFNFISLPTLDEVDLLRMLEDPSLSPDEAMDGLLGNDPEDLEALTALSLMADLAKAEEVRKQRLRGLLRRKTQKVRPANFSSPVVSYS